jgi:hypothetical protein
VWVCAIEPYTAIDRMADAELSPSWAAESGFMALSTSIRAGDRGSKCFWGCLLLGLGFRVFLFRV